jgi:hypothetical protein
MSPAASSERETAFAKNAVLDAGALAELREVTTAFERLAGTPPIESVPPAASRAAAYRRRGTMPAPVFLPQARDVFVHGRSGELRLRVLAPERDAAGVFLHLHGGGWVLGACGLQDEPLWEPRRLQGVGAALRLLRRLDDAEPAALGRPSAAAHHAQHPLVRRSARGRARRGAAACSGRLTAQCRPA